MSFFEKLGSFVITNFKMILAVVTILILIIALAFCIYRIETLVQKQEEKSEPVTMTSEQLKDQNYVQNKLDTTKEDSKIIVMEVGKAQSGTTQPVTNVTVTAPTTEKAVEQVKEKIKNNDATLPKEALEKTDKTVVAKQPENEEYKVGVYKINTYKNWGVGVGVGKKDGNTYIPIIVERQYAKDKSLEFQINYDISKHKIDGGQIVHKWHF